MQGCARLRRNAVEKPRRSREVTPNNGSVVVNEQLNMSYCQKAAEDSLEIDMLGYHTNFRLCELRDSQSYMRNSRTNS
jgi:hypothetical protein